jgi:hypothetical protein
VLQRTDDVIVEADAGVCLTFSLGVASTFDIMIVIPLYNAVAQASG